MLINSVVGQRLARMGDEAAGAHRTSETRFDLSRRDRHCRICQVSLGQSRYWSWDRAAYSSSMLGWNILFMKPILGDLYGNCSGSSTWIFQTPLAKGAVGQLNFVLTPHIASGERLRQATTFGEAMRPGYRIRTVDRKRGTRCVQALSRGSQDRRTLFRSVKPYVELGHLIIHQRDVIVRHEPVWPNFGARHDAARAGWQGRRRRKGWAVRAGIGCARRSFVS
jgi:hypothetical protein